LIIQRYLTRETALATATVTVVLLLLFLSGTFVRVLTKTMEGDYPAQALFMLFGLKAVGSLVFVLPLGLFLGVIIAFGRLYRDSEMVTLFACGLHPDSVVRVVLRMALVVALVVALLALWVGPRAEESGHRLLDELEASAEIEGIVPGRFNQSDAGDRLIYVEEMSADRTELRNVFVHARSDSGLQLLTAARGHEEHNSATGEHYLVLEDGYRYEGVPGRSDYRIAHFERHGLRLVERPITPSKRRRAAIPTEQLAHSDHPGDHAELHWRIAMPVSTLLLGILAVPFSRSSPRQGRYGKVFLGFLVYVIYNNLLTVGRSWMEGDKVGNGLGLWWVHGLMLLAIVVARRWYRGDGIWPWRRRGGR